jgi:ethanolamine ammonia-lyase large subunit
MMVEEWLSLKEVAGKVTKICKVQDLLLIVDKVVNLEKVAADLSIKR